MRLGIDASNLNRGGGLTHLTELLAIGDAQSHGFNEIIVWGTPDTLRKLRDAPNLRKVSPPALRRGCRDALDQFEAHGLGVEAIRGVELRSGECDVVVAHRVLLVGTDRWSEPHAW